MYPSISSNSNLDPRSGRKCQIDIRIPIGFPQKTPRRKDLRVINRGSEQGGHGHGHGSGEGSRWVFWPVRFSESRIGLEVGWLLHFMYLCTG